MQLRDHAPAALRGVATAASWFVIIACLWVADRNRRPNAFAVLVWLAALSALADSNGAWLYAGLATGPGAAGAAGLRSRRGAEQEHRWLARSEREAGLQSSSSVPAGLAARRGP